MEKKLEGEVLCDLYKSVHMALQSISNLSQSTDDAVIKQELLIEHEGYEKIAGKIAALMTEYNLPPKEPNFMKKAMLWSSVKVNTLTDSSKSKVADMMIKGTVMGVNQLIKILNEKEEILDEKVVSIAKEYLQLQEKYAEDLKKYL